MNIGIELYCFDCGKVKLIETDFETGPTRYLCPKCHRIVLAAADSSGSIHIYHLKPENCLNE